MRIILLLLITTSLMTMETPVSPVVKSTLDTYEAEAMKAFLAYNAAMEKIADKANKDLDTKMKAAMKASNLELATTIKNKMEEITKGHVLSSLEIKWKEELANMTKEKSKAVTIEGDWELYFAGMLQGIATFDKVKVGNPWKELWNYETKDKKLTINTGASGMHGIVITEMSAKLLKGTDGLGRIIEFKKKD